MAVPAAVAVVVVVLEVVLTGTPRIGAVAVLVVGEERVGSCAERGGR